MRVSFLCENVNKKMSLANRAVSQRSQLPILLNFLLKAKKGKFTITATDLEIGIEAGLPANIEEEGETTVPAKIFFDLLTNIGKGKITLYTDQNNLHFKTEKTKTVFQTIGAEEFPKIYEDRGDKIGVLISEVLEKDLPGIVFSASLDSGRPALSGVLMGKARGGNGFFMVATDGSKRSIKKGTAAGGDTGEKRLLVPARIIRELTLLKEDGDVTMFVSQKSNQVVFEQNDIVLVGRLIEAGFPNYQKIIPEDFSTRATMSREEFLSAVKTCSVFARESANIIKFSLAKKGLTVSASAPSLGETAIDVEASFEGEENEIAFNCRYVLEFLTNTQGEKIVFEMSGPLNPGVFKIEGDPDFLHIIMPIRVQSEG